MRYEKKEKWENKVDVKIKAVPEVQKQKIMKREKMEENKKIEPKVF